MKIKIRAKTDFITKDNGYLKGIEYDIAPEAVKDLLKHNYIELVPETRSKETATLKKPKNKRGI